MKRIENVTDGAKGSSRGPQKFSAYNYTAYEGALLKRIVIVYNFTMEGGWAESCFESCNLILPEPYHTGVGL